MVITVFISGLILLGFAVTCLAFLVRCGWRVLIQRMRREIQTPYSSADHSMHSSEYVPMRHISISSMGHSNLNSTIVLDLRPHSLQGLTLEESPIRVPLMTNPIGFQGVFGRESLQRDLNQIQSETRDIRANSVQTSPTLEMNTEARRQSNDTDDNKLGLMRPPPYSTVQQN